MKKTPTFRVSTLGCRVNQYESEAMSELFVREGFSPAKPGVPADVAVINTCAVTAESERKSRQLIRRARAENPDAVIVVTGCSAQLEGAALASVCGVDLVCGNAAKANLPKTAARLLLSREEKIGPAVDVTDLINAPYDGLTVSSYTRARAYLKIEDGCENRCAYCVIPSVRGPVRSKDPDSVLREAEALLRSGVKEIILTGIETGSYGFDFKERGSGSPLVSLLRGLDALGVPRIGMGSLEPTVLSADFIGAAKELSSVLPHFHLSVQSGSSSVLRSMRRRYDADMLKDRIASMRKAIPDATFSADVIVGFPGEDEALFAETVDFVKETRFLHLHIFPYSKRPGTEAAGMTGQIPKAEKKRRLSELGDVEAVIKKELLEEYAAAHAKGPVRVLVEKAERGIAHGHSEHWVEVSFPGSRADVGQVVDVLTAATDGRTVEGVRVL